MIYQESSQLNDNIKEHLMTIVQRTQQTEDVLKRCKESQEQFTLQCSYYNKLRANVNYQESQQDIGSLEKAKSDLNNFENLLKQKVSELNRSRHDLLSQQHEIFNQIVSIQQAVLFEHLTLWHQNQQLASNGAQTGGNELDKIQEWVEMLTDLTLRLRSQLKSLHHSINEARHIRFNHAEALDKLRLSIDRSLETLILNTFVVEKQPPQVMKTNTRFTSTVRFLSGSKLGVKLNDLLVRVTILSEGNARAIIQRHQEMVASSWAYLDCRQPSGQQVAPAMLSPTRQLQQQLRPVNQARVMQQPMLQPQPYAALPVETMRQTGVQPTANHHMMQQQLAIPSSQTQQQFFQQQHQPQHFPVQQQQQQNPPMTQMAPYHVAPPDEQQMANKAPFYPQKIINVNEFESSSEILNNSNSFEDRENTGQIICHFRNMQLKKIKRTEKKGTESVMDEKFVLLFHTEFRIPDVSSCLKPNSANSWVKQEDLWFQIMAFSLPVVVIVHGNQEPHAWATVTWHNAFARPDGLLYQVPDQVCWRDLGQVLSDKFSSCAGRGLSCQNLEYLASKVYRNRIESKDALVTWNQFAKEPLPKKTFTFWEWFHSILKLTKEHLRDLWNNDKIYGFVGKKGCVDLLLGSSYNEPAPVGTFLLRYSETELGGITIAWVSGSSQASNGDVQILQRKSPNPSSNSLMHLQPFVSRDLNTRSLADRIRDLKDLVYLYPDIPKDEAFGAYYTPLNDTSPLPNGYIKPMLIQTLVENYPKNIAANSMDCAITPATPSSFSQSSPDGIYQDNAYMSDVDFCYPPYGQVANEFNNTLQ